MDFYLEYFKGYISVYPDNKKQAVINYIKRSIGYDLSEWLEVFDYYLNKDPNPNPLHKEYKEQVFDYYIKELEKILWPLTTAQKES